MKKALKIFSIVAASLLALFVGAAVLLFLSLPSPGEIGKSFAKSAKGKVGNPNSKSESPQPKASPSTDSPAPDREDQNAKSDSDAGQIHLTEEENLKLLEDLTDPSQKKYDVCENLKNYRMLPADFVYTKEALNRNFGDLFTTDHKDPVLMAVMGPIRYVLQQPKMRIFLASVEKAIKEKQDDSFLKKAEFYSQLYPVYEEMKSQRQAAEAIADRGYHLFMMSKAVAKNPSLLTDPQFIDYCKNIEDAANKGLPTQWNVEQAEFQKFLADAHIESSEIGYDPNYRTQLQFENSKGRLRFHGGWLDTVFAGSSEKKH